METVAKVSEVPDFGKKVISVSGREILLVKVKGEIFAVENECPHQGSSMAGAVVKDAYIACPRHGFRFNLADGRCTDHPEFILETFQVHLNGDEIMLDLG